MLFPEIPPPSTVALFSVMLPPYMYIVVSTRTPPPFLAEQWVMLPLSILKVPVFTLTPPPKSHPLQFLIAPPSRTSSFEVSTRTPEPLPVVNEFCNVAFSPIVAVLLPVIYIRPPAPTALMVLKLSGS